MDKLAVCLLGLLLCPLGQLAQAQEAKAKQDEHKDEVHAKFTVNKKTYDLKHAIAFEGYWFDDKVPSVLITEKKLSREELLEAVNKGFDAQQMFMLRRGRYLIFQFADEGEAPIVGGWADNLSLGSSSDLKSESKIEGGIIEAQVSMPKPDALGPFTYQFQAKFKLRITK